MVLSYRQFQQELQQSKDDGFVEQAKELLYREIQLNPNDPNLRIEASTFFRSIGDYLESYAQVQQAIGLMPGNLSLQGSLIQDLISLHRYEDANAISESLRAHPSSAGIRRILSFSKRLFDVRQKYPLLFRAWEHSKSPIRVSNLITEPSPVPDIQPFQYWSQGEPPQDIKNLTLLWNALLSRFGLPRIQLFNKRSAADWIKENAPQFERPFKTAYHYTIQSNVFRVAFTTASRACMWIDCDFYPKSGAKSVIDAALKVSQSILFFREYSPWVAPGFFIARSNCRFFAQLADQGREVDYSIFPEDTYPMDAPLRPSAYNNILYKALNDCCLVNFVTSSAPDQQLASLRTDELSVAFCNEQSLAWLSPPPWVDQLAYKSTDNAWQNYFGKP